MLPLTYVPYHLLDGRPNVVVDGSTTVGTTLTLSHWPGYPPPPELAADLSAEIAFRYLDAGGTSHGPARAASNNHFDQDGLVGLFALCHPTEALARKNLLEDLAAAGDFATYRARRAARLAIAVAVFADVERSPIVLEADAAERTAQLYGEMLGRLPQWCDEPDSLRHLWADEDASLAADEACIASGEVRIEEHPELDLAVAYLPDDARPGGGHRFAHQRYPGLHPMAMANATERLVLVTLQGRRYRLRYRYESWVTYRSRVPRARRALAPLAEILNAEESATTTWRGDPSAALEPVLCAGDDAESSIAPSDFLALVCRYLREAPPDWDPYRSG
ncbi:MAG TPA: DUF6687 family protein [Acidimicrobiales bacterium]|nr:DUF6687 family protein [Acidimicrobiales bacterium]